ncbi:amidohydrolase family protein [Sphingomonas histidinilytica]|uniref:Cytosine/adenosine deaminase n=1 Tax=Rhizorhabdus histidinilytica TaxID=439228 RepID=A0A1T5BKX8_9SPHN|nr:amidohydrolase family protein [Rhizorhabdus histidinilytica]MBO9377400.1 amidohydrolase family protein [Rhizorhabdus histidinilytica]SKB47942.1 Cytosine/adenosine deaminase [Rhizorhabdus histidinilytica]
MSRTLISGGVIVSVDSAIGVLPKGDVLIEGERIVAVGPHVEAGDAEVVDARGMIVMPGLINAHLHSWQSGLRSIGGGWTGPDYHRVMHGNLATRFQPEDNYIGTLFGALEQLNGGVTTIFDWCHDITSLEHAERSVDALEEVGIRAVFGHGSAKPMTGEDGIPFTHKPHPRERLEALRRGRFTSDDRLVTLAAAILGPQFSVPEVVEHDFRMVKELGLMSSSHAARRLKDRLSPEGFRIPARLGLLDATHNVVHGNYLDEEELKIVVDSGASVTVTSMIELHVHAADPLTGRLRTLGAMPSLGVDSIPIANGDMFSEMRLSMLFQRAMEHRINEAQGLPPLTKLPVPSEDILRYATIGGARALCMEHRIGSLTPGKQADVILIDANAMNMFPVHEPVQSVVWQSAPSNVDTVFVGGQLRKRGGRLLYSETTLARRREQLLQSIERILAEAEYTPAIEARIACC